MSSPINYLRMSTYEWYTNTSQKIRGIWETFREMFKIRQEDATETLEDVGRRLKCFLFTNDFD